MLGELDLHRHENAYDIYEVDGDELTSSQVGLEESTIKILSREEPVLRARTGDRERSWESDHYTVSADTVTAQCEA